MIVDIYLALTLTVALVHCGKSNISNKDKRTFSSDIKILTTHGYVQGKTEKIRVIYGQTVDVDVFWGIPYAKPPVGDLRFWRPVPSEPWDGVLHATTPPNSCIQVFHGDTILAGNVSTAQSEDCLYLNIWRPNCKDAKRKMATLFWIHGGSFMSGSSTDPVYNGAAFAATRCVIVVSMNYRLGAFGFLYLAIPESRGNMGLLDVTLALTWIKNNVENFEGNKNRITIVGNGAGAAIASMFLLSPVAQPLFYSAIIQSGNPFSKYYHQSKGSAFSAAYQLARTLGCYSNNMAVIAKCLKSVPATNLARMHDMDYLMKPVTDGIFLPKDPMSILLLGDIKRCDIIVGTTRDEGTHVLKLALPEDYDFTIQQPHTLNDAELDQTMTRLFMTTFKQQFMPQIIAAVRSLYDYDKLKKEVVNPSLTLLNHVTRDLIFACPAYSLVNVYAKLSHNVYLYSFNHRPDNTTLPAWVGATHGVEVPFVLGTTTHTLPTFSPRDALLSEKIMKLWEQFAFMRSPTPERNTYPRWPPFTFIYPNMFLFTENAEVRIGSHIPKYCAYWNSIPPEFLID